MLEFIVSKFWELAGVDRRSIEVKNVLSKERFVLNPNNTQIRMILWFNSLGAVMNLISLASLCLVVAMGSGAINLLCISIIFAINIFIKCLVIAGIKKICSKFEVGYLRPINTVDIISFVLGYITIAIVGTSLEMPNAIIKFIVMLFVTILVYIISLENIHKLFIEIKLHKKYDEDKDIKLRFNDKALACDGCKVVDDDIIGYHILCVEHDNCFELLLCSTTLGVRKSLLLINACEREDLDIDNVSLYKVITDLHIGEHIINMDNIKEYL